VVELRTRGLLVAGLAASAGAHAGLTPAHVAEGVPVAVLFAVSAAALAVTAVIVDRSRRQAAYSLAAVLLGGLLVAYAASRVMALWPLEHREGVDAVGALTKLVELAGLVLALHLLHSPADGVQELFARHEGAGP
jgi:hypothetical protein